MPEWAAFALVFAAGFVVGRLFTGRREGAGPPAAPPPPAPADVDERIRQLLVAGQKIQAVRLYREATGAGLKDSRDYVEALARSTGLG